jgi:hypothetical protein
MGVDALLSEFASWCASREDVIAAVLVGSHARGTATDDSDVDLLLVCNDPDAYVSDSTWVSHFGPVDKTSTEDYGLVTSLRVFYSDGPEVEFGFTTAAWAEQPLDSGTAEVLDAGYRVLYDPKALLAGLTSL